MDVMDAMVVMVVTTITVSEEVRRELLRVAAELNFEFLRWDSGLRS